MKLKWKRVHPDAQPPFYASEGAAAFDLVAVSRDHDVFGTGLAFDIPEGYALFIYSRSGHGFNHNTRLANAVGVIDADYTGEVKIKLTRDDPHPINVEIGDRIAQAVLAPAVRADLIETTQLKDTERGENGFGSTGR
jgi:dUTP pyrophosphatase